MNTDNDLKKREKQRRDDMRFAASIICNTIESMMKRTSIIKDPMSRHLLTADKLCVVIDIGYGLSKSFIEDKLGQNNEIDENENIENQKIGERLDFCFKALQGKINEMVDWIQNPVYSPDHPGHGIEMMNKSKSDFVNKSYN